jgi:hypothetical protein
VKNTLDSHIEHLLEVNRIVSGIANKSGMPKQHTQDIWDEVDKEVVKKHQFGVVDKYKQIGSIVRAKLGVPDEDDEKNEADTDGK